MSAEKLSSPRGDLELLCGRLAPSKEEAQVSCQTPWTSKFLCRHPDYPPIGGNQKAAKKGAALLSGQAQKKMTTFYQIFSKWNMFPRPWEGFW